MGKDIVMKGFGVGFHTSLGRVEAVRKVNTVFENGLVTGMIGESGSGKSVLGMGILKLLASNAEIFGQCFYGEEQISSFSEKEMEMLRGKEIALIPQNPAEALNPVIKIKKQLLEAVTVHDKKKKNMAEKRYKNLLNQFGFSDAEEISGKYSFQLSGGMNQRIISALGLMCTPRWIIADEPTKGLDAILRRQVYEVLKGIVETETKSMIVITHDVILAQRLCNKILILYRGEVLEQGDTKLVLDTPAHPYSQGLVCSLPSKGMIPIPASIDERQDSVEGCVFYARCKKAADKCKHQRPDDVRLEDGRIVRCFLYD